MPDEDHVHGPECEALAREYRIERATTIVASYEPEKREPLLQAARGGIEKMRDAHPDLTDEQLGSVLETVADMITQIMQTPAYALSDTLTDSAALYSLGSSHLLAGFGLGAVPALPEPGTPTDELPLLDERTGMYL